MLMIVDKFPWVFLCFEFVQIQSSSICQSARYLKRLNAKVDFSKCRTNFATKEVCLNYCFENLCAAALFADHGKTPFCCIYFNESDVYHLHGKFTIYYKYGINICEANQLPPNCSVCVNKYDITSGCTSCLRNYDITTDCATCTENYDIKSDCRNCIENYEITSNCTLCVDNYNLASGCTLCVENYASASSCTLCKGNYDINFGCKTCIGNYDLDVNCTLCSGHFDIASECTRCIPNWVGFQCNSCDFGLMGPNCNECATGVGWTGEYIDYSWGDPHMTFTFDFYGSDCESFTGTKYIHYTVSLSTIIQSRNMK